MAGSVDCTIYLWDHSDSHPVKIFVGHTGSITSLVFSSSLISSSKDKSIKFWPVGASLTDAVMINPEPTPPSLASIVSINLQVEDGIVLSTDKAGVVEVWDLSTGLHKASFHVEPRPQGKRNMRLVDGRLIVAWCTHNEINIWDSGKEEHLLTIDTKSIFLNASLAISGDGAKVFILDHKWLRARSTLTGDVVGRVQFESKPSKKPLIVDGSKVWVCFENLPAQGLDFGVPGPSPTRLPSPPPVPDRLHLDFIDGTIGQGTGPSRIQDHTGNEVYWLPKKYAKPTAWGWNGQLLVAGYESGEVLILDFIHMIPK